MNLNANAESKNWIYFSLAFALGLSLRLLFLGVKPLSEPEASLALQALGVAHGSPAPISSQSLYLLLTGTLFFLFGNDNFLARLVPAIAGSLLVLSPVLFQRQLGRRTALWLSFALALEPGLVALSRQAGGPIPAIAFTALAFGFWNARKAVLAGICAGLALLGGTSIWPGLVGISLAILYSVLFLKPQPLEEDQDVEPVIPPQPSFRWSVFLLSTIITLLAVGTLLMRFPRGLTARAGGFPEFIVGWGQFSGISVLELLAALLVYSLPAVVLGGWTAVAAWRRRDLLDQGLTVWLVVALVLTFVYPSRTFGDLAWSLIPLWTLTARGLSRLALPAIEDRWAVVIFSCLVVVISGFAWLNLTGLVDAAQLSPDSLQVRGIAIIGSLLLLAVAVLLVGWGWSGRIAIQGLVYGGLFVLLAYLIFGMTSAAGIRAHSDAELWQSYPQPQDARYLIETIGNLSEWNTGNKQAIQLVVVGVPSDALRWALLNMPNAEFASILAPGSQPSLVITPQEQQPALAASYRGQDFVWNQSPDWQTMDWIGRLSWFTFRNAPLQSQKVILWARTDLFLDRPTTGATHP